MKALFFTLAIIFLVIGLPIAFAIGLSSIVYILGSGMPAAIIIQRLFAGIDRAPLMAIPFFILAGELMNQGGIARRLVALLNALVGNVHGSLGIVTVISCMFFAAISGSGVATTAAIGAVMLPEMAKARYNKEFASAIVGVASPIGVIIPPSITFIIYGVLTGTSIADLYKAGIPSGILIGLLLIVYVYIVARKNNIRTEVEKKTIREKLFLLRNAIWALGAPVILLGGVFSGIFTPTESAVVAVIYSLLVGFFIYKDLSFKDTYRAIERSAIMTAKIMLIVSTATLFAFILTFERIPQEIVENMGAIAENKILALLIINLILLVMGAIMETGAIIFIMVPLLWPVVNQIGLDPVHFCMILTVNTAIGLVTPPFGVCLFTAANVGKVAVEKLSISVLLPIVFMLAGLLIITYFPRSIMFLVGR